MIAGLSAISPTTLGVSLATGAMLLFAVCNIITAVATRDLDTDAGALLAAATNVPCGLAFIGLQVSLGGTPATPSLLGLAGFLLAGVFSTYLGRWLIFKSIETMGPTLATSFQTSSPLMVVLFGWLLLGEHLGAMAVVGIVLGAAGLAIMSGGAGRQQPVHGGQRTQTNLSGARRIFAIGLGASAAYAVSNILRAAAVRDWNEPLVGVTLGAAAGFLALMIVSRRQLSSIRARVAANPRSALLYAGIGTMQLGGQALMIASMNFIPASYAALISMSTPLVVLPLSLITLRSKKGITPHTILGMLATIAGVALLMWH